MAKDNILNEKESKTDIAYRILSKKKKERNFYEIWDEVKKEIAKTASEEEISKLDDDISFFYTNLTLDGRFVNVGDNKWNLRERVPFEKVHIDMNEVYAEEEEENSDIDNEEDSDMMYDDNYEDSYDDSTGSDADIGHYRDVASSNEDEDM